MAEPRTPILVLNRHEVERSLDLDRLRTAVARAMVDVSAGRVSMPNRVAATVAERDGLLAAMPAFLPSANALTTKLVSLFPANRDRPTHQAVLVCFDAANGTPIALLDATVVTAARTAAGSAVSTDVLARGEATTVAILGTGVQAAAHARAIVRVRPFTRMLVAGRDPDRANGLAASLRPEVGIAIEVLASFDDAVGAADVVCATTHAAEPIVRWDSLRPGSHVTSVGFNTAGTGEVDAETIRRSTVFVESREAALAPPPSGAVELIGPTADGTLEASRIRELGEVLDGIASGRTSDTEVTLYKSVGIAAQDAAAAALVLDEARRTGAGSEIEL
jgi:ornithine cyclodeaminase/alanine dehydrogenase-like protein (mu-crystallin family)